ncbi:ComF family protein [Patescibacteria group bacterium]|nr:ComF family protein [Patescibacteria group bacterium]MBU4000114.1 ComF family protein [Patescibacteria group bacterium]MBU4056875.1 ComF family protein [Patescibacteria group bacterium]MBU4368985.1 ComF family protein [Patescibacteria group bacterium]
MAANLILAKIGTFILDIIFPIQCLSCSKEGEWICKECFKKIELLKKQACPICGNESKGGARCFNCRNKSELDGVISAAAYWKPAAAGAKETKNGLVKEAIHVFKYRFVKDLSKPLAELMREQLKNRQIFRKEKPIPFGPDIENDKIVIPVPLHPKRLRWRGFNQAELLAKNLAKRLDLPLENSVLARTKNNIPQVEIKDRKERMENIKGAFDCAESPKLKNKIVILVDDVCTTAGTLSECAKALKNSGAREVWGAVVARG